MKIGDCIHYNGAFKNQHCQANVEYEFLTGGRGRGWMVRLPCIETALSDTENVVNCPNKTPATKTDVEEWLNAGKDSLAKITKIRKLIEELVEPGISSQGVVKCPYCKNEVNYTHAGCNGHIHAACSGGCVAWME